MVSTILALLNTIIFVNKDVLFFPPGSVVRVCFRVVRCSISQSCTFGMEPATMKCPILAGSAVHRSNCQC